MNLHSFVIPRATAHKRSLQDGGVAVITKNKKGKGEEKKVKAKTKSCKTCKNRDGPSFDGPCLGCSARLDFNHWEVDPEL